MAKAVSASSRARRSLVTTATPLSTMLARKALHVA
jgi:hypothetical protein